MRAASMVEQKDCLLAAFVSIGLVVNLVER